LITQRSLRGPLSMTLLALSMWLGCGDDSSTDGGGGQGAEGSGGRTGSGGASGSTTAATSTTSNTTGSSTSSSGGGGQGGSGGGMTSSDGHEGTEFVNAGEVCESPGYRLVYTLGQPTTNQETMTSTGYRLQGGFVGATGSVQ
jgi:hypothetical protein